ncbi:MAG: phosphatase PAP2 family protein [Prevotella sp.]|nr:phosphatase PAP2 family protein [Prevotella sp.]MDY4218613.1 phosphatase PAP2 family protein [Prevotella sp.]
MNFEHIKDIDISILLSLQGGEQMFIDQLVITLTNGFTWIPLYISILYLIIKNNEKWSQILLLLAVVAVAMLASNLLNGGFIKPFIARLRPTSDPHLINIIHPINNYQPAGYSFFSAHACNSFTIAVLISLIVRSRLLTSFLLAWATLNAWTRLYLAAHYPSDVVVGMIAGATIASLCYLLYMRLYLKITPKINYVSSHYTKMGYNFSDIDIVVLCFVLTILYALLRTVIELGI